MAYIRARLLAKGVAEPLAFELAPDEDSQGEIDAAFRRARRRRIGPFCPDLDARRRDRQRHLAMLAREGFSQEVALAVIDAEAASEPR